MSQKNPRVSVIAGAYNITKTTEMELAIKSILEQTFTDFEFIICDDGSTDGTYQRLKTIAKQDKRIIILQNSTNQGLHQTLNNCLAVARGEYIARMDMDDYSLPDRFAKQVKFLDEHPEFALVTSCAFLFDDNHSVAYGERRLPEQPTKRDMLFNSPFLHAGAMLRKASLQQVDGYRVAKETRRAEDYDLWMRMYAAGMIGYNLQENLYGIREDSRAYARRKYRYRIDEAIVRYKGFKKLGLLPRGFAYVVKPLVVGLIPTRLLRSLKTKRGDS